jgi:16S rRNA (uracil1498-N3)-methyltransferase
MDRDRHRAVQRMKVRLFLPAGPLERGPITVDGGDHHYLFRVRRLRVGDEVAVLDGRGKAARAIVRTITAEQATLDVGDPVVTDTRSVPPITVVLPLLKGDRTEWCIDKLVELGVSRIVPVHTRRSVVRVSGERAVRRQQRLADRATQAARQCRNALIPQVDAISSLAGALPRAAGELNLLLWEGSVDVRLRAKLPLHPPSSIAIAAGPEGGLAKEEVEVATSAGYQPVGLGPRILRAETAPVAVTAIIGFQYGDLG